jgi:hypothetical protein
VSIRFKYSLIPLVNKPVQVTLTALLPRIVERAPTVFALLMAVVGWSVDAGNY